MLARCAGEMYADHHSRNDGIMAAGNALMCRYCVGGGAKEQKNYFEQALN
mgnify:CR=1 FL=1